MSLRCKTLRMLGISIYMLVLIIMLVDVQNIIIYTSNKINFFMKYQHISNICYEVDYSLITVSNNILYS
jgi:hypothetical protein